MKIGATEYEASEAAGLHRNYIFDFLKGRKDTLRNRNLAKIAEALGVDPDWIVGKTDDPEIKPLTGRDRRNVQTGTLRQLSQPTVDVPRVDGGGS